jgi:hypothetical protein
VKPLNLQEVGTREQHYHELLDLWSDALAVLLESHGDKPAEPATLTALRKIKDVSCESQVKHMATVAITQYEEPVAWRQTHSAAIDGLNTALATLKHTLENTPGCGGIHGNYDERYYYRAVNAVTNKVIDNTVPLF